MHEDSPILEASLRERIGSRYAQRARAAGHLPGVIYGHKEQPVAINLNAKNTLGHILKGEKVFRISLDGGEPEMVLLKELQFGYLGDNIIHADFARVSLTERVHTKVHVKLIGDAIGLKRAGAVLVHPVTELELDVQVSNIVDHIEVDVSNLDVDQLIHASEVKLPIPTMKLLTDPNAIVAQIMLVGNVESDEEAGTTTTAEPEVLTERKKEES